MDLERGVVIKNFYPRPPGGGRQDTGGEVPYLIPFLSTPSGWRATRRPSPGPFGTRYFYPRPPGGGRRLSRTTICIRTRYFYPRPPGGGRHGAARPHHSNHKYFYPRPPGGGRQPAINPSLRAKSISIHALRVEGDAGFAAASRFSPVFLSTPSGWRATTRR